MKRFTSILSLVLALCLLLAVSAFASGEPAGAPSGEPSGDPSGEASGETVKPGEYTDGTYTLVIAEDMTFSMDKKGANMEGEEFVLTVTGTVTPDAKFTVVGLFDGDIDLSALATEEQIAADLATVEAVYAAATASSGEPSGEKAPGEYTDGVNTLVLAADGTFTMNKTGQNMEGAEFVLTVKGHLAADGSVVLDGLFDGDIDLLSLATAEQIAADIASVEAALAG